MLDYNSLLS